MELTGATDISASPEVVWRALNDPEVLSKAIPGSEGVTRLSDHEFDAVAAASIGPVKAKFKGKVTLSNINPPLSYTITGEGTGGVAGFAKGSAEVRLEPLPDGTRLHYAVKAQVGGKLAQVGQRLIDAAARKMADDFFTRFSQIVAQPIPATEVLRQEAAAPSAGNTTQAALSAKDSAGLPQSVWIPLLILVVAGIVALALAVG